MNKTRTERLKLWGALALIAVAVILLGFLRDHIFKTINALLRAWDLEEDYFLPSFLSFLENFEYETLVNLKWVLTFVFSLFYLIVTVITTKFLFSKRQFLRIAVFTYAAIFAVSLVFIAIGFVFSGTSEKMYEFARYLMGMAQSPLILMILIPAFKLSEKEINKTTEL